MERGQRHEYAANDTSIDALLYTLDGPDYAPDVSLDAEWAALHVGVCTKTCKKTSKNGSNSRVRAPSGRDSKTDVAVSIVGPGRVHSDPQKR
jgi:hypothetical protein